MRPLAALSPRAVGVIAALITVTIWTSFIVIARASAQHTLGPFDIAYARILGAGAVLLPWGWWLARQQVRAGGAPGWLGLSPLPARLTVLTGLFGGLLYAMLAYAGFFYAPAAHAAVLMPGSLPLWTTLLAVIWLREPLTRERALGLALIVAGDLAVGGASLLAAFDGGDVWRGDLLFMAAALCWSVYSVLVRRHGIEAVRATVAITVFAFVTYIPAYTALMALDAVPTRLPLASWREIAFQAVFQGMGSVVISGITFNLMIRHYGPVRSTMITALVPGLSALGAVLFLGEPLHAHLMLGLALVTIGIVFGVRASAGPARPAPQRPAAEGGRT